MLKIPKSIPIIPIDSKLVKCVCEKCGCEVPFLGQCFLCGEINWSDEVLDRFKIFRAKKLQYYSVAGPQYHITMTRTLREYEKEAFIEEEFYRKRDWEFRVYPKDFRLM